MPPFAHIGQSTKNIQKNRKNFEKPLDKRGESGYNSKAVRRGDALGGHRSLKIEQQNFEH